MSETQTRCLIGSREHQARRGYLCEGHFAHLAEMLRDIEDQAATLDVRPSMQMRTGSGGGGLASHRSPARLDAIVAGDPRRGELDWDSPTFDPWGLDETMSVLETLHGICRQVREERCLTSPETVTISDERDFITRQLAWLAEQPYIDETYDILRSLLNQLRSTNGHRADRPLTRCVLPTANGLCGGNVWEQEVEGVVETTSGRWRMTVPGGPAVCDTCGASWVTDADKARLKLMIEQEHDERTRPRTEDGRRMLTQDEMAAQLGATINAVRIIISRKHIPNVNGHYDPDLFSERQDKASA